MRRRPFPRYLYISCTNLWITSSPCTEKYATTRAIIMIWGGGGPVDNSVYKYG